MALKQESKLIQAHIKEVLAGKSSAYEQLYRTHAERIYTLGLKFYDHNKQAGEELTKRVFIKGFEQINTYSENITFILWLKKLAVEEIRIGGIEKSKEIHQASVADRAVFALPEEERIIFILHDVEKHTVEEILEITKTSGDEVNAMLENARKLVMEKLNVNSLDDLDYKINFLSIKPEPNEELWGIIYTQIHNFATKDLKEEAKGDILNVGDAKLSLGEKFQKFKEEREEGEEKEEKEVFLKPKGLTILRKAFYPFLMILIGVVVWYLFFLKPPQWEVVNLSGSPSIKGSSRNIVVEKSSILEDDDLLSTNQNSKAVIKIPDVGEIYLNPNSKLKRNGGDGEIAVTSGGVDVVKKKGSKKSFPVQIFSAIIEDYNAGSYSIKVNDDSAIVYSMTASLLISSGDREVHLIPEYMCEINQKSQIGIPYSISASEEFVNAVNDFSLQANEERLNIILLQSEKKDALTLFNILPMVEKGSRDIVINKLHSLVRIPKDVSPHQVANLNKGDLEKWLKAIEEQN